MYMIQHMQLRPVIAIPIHDNAFAHPLGPGKVTGVFMVKPNKNSEPRLCYQITYRDGFVDYIPIEDKGYKIVPEIDMT